MKTFRSIACGAAVVVALSGAATAQDWDGFYGGVSVGYAFGDATHSFSNLAPTDNSNPEGVLIGGFVGYGYQSGNTVWGGEVDLEFSNYEGSFVNTTGATSQGVIEGQWQGSIRAVLGLAGSFANKPALYYATGGWAVGEFDFLGGPSVPVPPGGGYSETMNGWTAGVGLGVRVAPNTTMRIEYRYTDFGEASGRLGPTFPAVTMPVDVTQHAVRFGMRMEF
ncbi:MAG: outer membrane beta-barrel protein [Rhodobacter sp.]|nr:outer membrane beta-barrel protein [Rhodobacter sp.]